MSISINTNAAAMVALQNLRSVDSLNQFQNRFNTGLKVSDSVAIDLGASIRSSDTTNGYMAALNDRLFVEKNAASSESRIVADLQSDSATLRQIAIRSADTAIDNETRNALRNQAEVVLSGMSERIKVSKEIAGERSGFGTGTLEGVYASISGRTTPAVERVDVESALNSLSESIRNNGITTDTLSSIDSFNDLLGTAAKTANGRDSWVSSQIQYNSNIGSFTNISDSMFPDVDLAQESARLSSLQTKQQLGAQSLMVANQAPQTLLSLFR